MPICVVCGGLFALSNHRVDPVLTWVIGGDSFSLSNRRIVEFIFTSYSAEN